MICWRTPGANDKMHLPQSSNTGHPNSARGVTQVLGRASDCSTSVISDTHANVYLHIYLLNLYWQNQLCSSTSPSVCLLVQAGRGPDPKPTTEQGRTPFFLTLTFARALFQGCQSESAFRGLGALHSTSCWCTCRAFPWGVRKFLQNTEGKSYPGDVLTVPYTKEKKSSQKLGSTGSSSQDDGRNGGLCPSLLAAGPHGWWLGDVPRKV